MRLAPISTVDQPKPFIPLPDGKSLLTRTLERVHDPMFLLPVLVGQANHRFSLLNHARAASVTPQAILLEPQPKNTAMAIACAAVWALRYQPESILAILPADQVIEPTTSWLGAIQDAAYAAEIGELLCLLGVTPTRPDPNFGYIELGERVPYTHAQHVAEFIEKPQDPAALMAKSVWNAGQFIVTPRVLEALMLATVPDIWLAAEHAVAGATRSWEFTELGAASYAGLSPRSFDRAVVERSPSMCVRLSAHWHDLGTVAAWEAFTCQPAESYLRRPVRTDRPWGYYEQLQANDVRLEKRLTIFPGCRLSRQRHQYRSETWQVLAGTADIELDQQQYRLTSGETIHIPAWSWHRLANVGGSPLQIHEIQFGKPDESDIERSADDYGRINDSNLSHLNI